MHTFLSTQCVNLVLYLLGSKEKFIALDYMKYLLLKKKRNKQTVTRYFRKLKYKITKTVVNVLVFPSPIS